MTSVVDFNNPGSYVILVERADWTYGQNANMTKIPATVAKSYNVADIGFPDNTLSGIVIPPFTKVILWDDINNSGDYLTLDSGGSTLAIQDLRAFRGADNNPGQNFNDLTSSITVVPGATPAMTVGCCTGTTPADQCGAYVPGSSVCTANMISYCDASHMGTPVCQAWCRANPGLCDAAAITYCKGNTDPFCTCVNSPLGTIPSVNPTCYDQTCINKSGYRTAPMMSACPPISQTTCTQINNIAAGGKIDLNLFQFTQSCGNQTTTNTGQTGTTTTGNTGGTGGTTGNTTTGSTTTGTQQTQIAQQQAAAQLQLMQQQAAYQQAMAQYQQQLAQWQQQQAAANSTQTTPTNNNTILGIASWLFYTMIFIIIVVIGAIIGIILYVDDEPEPQPPAEI